MEKASLFDRLAALFRYPTGDYVEMARRCQQAVGVTDPEAAALLARFLDRMRDLSIEAQQELFTGTFDLNPACALEVGWHLFGENYERGAFLIKMRGQLARFGLAEAGELPDHLTLALAVLGRMPAEEAAEFAGACLLPALAKMRAGLAGKENPFELVLEAITRLLERMYGPPSGGDPQVALPAGNGRGL